MKHFEFLTMFAHAIKPKDIDYIRLFWSIKEKILVHNYFLSQFDSYFKIVKDEINEWDGKGIKGTKNHIRLLAYFETILNNGYSIMENIAKITLPFFPNNSLPHSFHKQLKWFKKKSNLSIDKKYSAYLTKNLGWYGQLREIRSEPTHFLSGVIVFDKDKEGIYTPRYFNKIKSGRGKRAIKTDSINISLDFVREVERETSKFLEFYGKHFISTLDQNQQTNIPSMSVNQETGKVSIKNIPVKLKDLISGKIQLKVMDYGEV